MAFKYEEAVPWGRSFDEYCRMFDLTTDDLERSILGCADGPASFNAEMSRLGKRVISCDPLYRFTREQIQSGAANCADYANLSFRVICAIRGYNLVDAYACR